MNDKEELYYENGNIYTGEKENEIPNGKGN